MYVYSTAHLYIEEIQSTSCFVHFTLALPFYLHNNKLLLISGHLLATRELFNTLTLGCLLIKSICGTMMISEIYVHYCILFTTSNWKTLKLEHHLGVNVYPFENDRVCFYLNARQQSRCSTTKNNVNILSGANHTCSDIVLQEQLCPFQKACA